MGFKKSLKGLLAGLLVGAGTLSSWAGGKLEIINYTDDLSININSVFFQEGSGDTGYTAPITTPSLDIYYEDFGGNKHSTAGVNLSTNKTYNCPLEGVGTIPNGTQNDLAFKLQSDFPSNTSCSAVITDGSFTNTINDVINFYKNGTKDSEGYVHYLLPATTNASNRKYGNLQIRFAPTKKVTATAPTWANVSPPGNTNYYSTNIPYGTSQTFSVSPGEVIINNGLRRERITGLRIVEK